MNEKKKSPADNEAPKGKETLNSLALSSFAEVLRDVDGVFRPVFIELVLLVAIQQVAQERGLTRREQLHIWRPMDV